MEALGVVGFQRPFQKRVTSLYTDTKKSYDNVTEPAKVQEMPEMSPLHRKLRIQKNRLITWGLEWSDIRAAQPDDIDESLERAGLRDIVTDVMSSIKEILDEAEGMRYRGKSDVITTFGNEKTGEKEMLGSHWSTADKSRFEDLLRDLTTSIDTLYDLSRSHRAPRQSPLGTRLAKGANAFVEQARGYQPRLLPRKSISDVQSVFPPPNTLTSGSDISLRIEPSSLIFPEDASWQSSQPPPYEAIATTSNSRVLAYLRRPHTSTNPWKTDGNRILTVPVLVEFAPFDPIYTATGIFPSLNRLETLAASLHCSSESQQQATSGILNLLGYYEDQKHPRYGLVYELPQNVDFRSLEISKPLERMMPVSLLSLLQRDTSTSNSFVPNLEDRLQLAYQLSSTFFQFHAKKLVHRDVNSSNVILFPMRPPGSSPLPSGIEFDLRSPYLSSFDLFSEYDVETSTGAQPAKFYRHPLDARNTNGDGNKQYIPAFDIYGLGLVLLEIGLWMPLHSFWKTKYTPSTFKNRLENIYVKKLASKCGTFYMRVVQTCLSAADEQLLGADPESNMQMKIHWQVVKRLERCCFLDEDDPPSPIPTPEGLNFEPPQPTNDHSIEEQFAALMEKRSWYNLPRSARQQMTSFPPEKKWTLIHQDSLVERQGNMNAWIERLPGFPSLTVDVAGTAEDIGSKDRLSGSPGSPQASVQIHADQDTASVSAKIDTTHSAENVQALSNNSLLIEIGRLDDEIQRLEEEIESGLKKKKVLSRIAAFRQRKNEYALLDQDHAPTGVHDEKAEIDIVKEKMVPSLSNNRAIEETIIQGAKRDGPGNGLHRTPSIVEPLKLAEARTFPEEMPIDSENLPARKRLRVHPVKIPLSQLDEWHGTILPRLEQVLKKALKDSPETVSMDLIGIGEFQHTARPTIFVTCTSVAKVKGALNRRLKYNKEVFDLKVRKGKIRRSKMARKKRRLPHRSAMSNSSEHDQQPAKNPFHQERPLCGASIGAFKDEDHLPPVSYGGVVLIDGEPFGMTVHHLLDAPSEDGESEYEEDDSPIRSSGRWAPNQTLVDPGFHNVWAPVPEALYPYEISESEGEWDSMGESESHYFESDESSGDEDLVDEDGKAWGDIPGVEKGDGADYIITQPAMDDVEEDFFPTPEDRNQVHLHSHKLGHVHASSGVRRCNRKGVEHEIDWALLKINDDRLQPYNLVQGGKRFCHGGPQLCPRLVEPVSRQFPPEDDLYPVDVAGAEELSLLRVHCFGRTSGLQEGTISPAMSSVRIYGRRTFSRSWHVVGNFGVGGDSGAWVIDNEHGRVCGHVLAWCSKNAIAYICPMQVLFEDMARTLETSRVTLPGAEEIAASVNPVEQPIKPTKQIADAETEEELPNIGELKIDAAPAQSVLQNGKESLRHGGRRRVMMEGILGTGQLALG
ncbi:MAG: hypothetical protein M1827_002620 [Pycnora praestabilis]|nr:MAG: hypothetical protein M1827_002620 [Pycnora praestabilis]